MSDATVRTIIYIYIYLGFLCHPSH
jgi:hypothetical protein